MRHGPGFRVLPLRLRRPARPGLRCGQPCTGGPGSICPTLPSPRRPACPGLCTAASFHGPRPALTNAARRRWAGKASVLHSSKVHETYDSTSDPNRMRRAAGSRALVLFHAPSFNGAATRRGRDATRRAIRGGRERASRRAWAAAEAPGAAAAAAARRPPAPVRRPRRRGRRSMRAASCWYRTSTAAAARRESRARSAATCCGPRRAAQRRPGRRPSAPLIQRPAWRASQAAMASATPGGGLCGNQNFTACPDRRVVLHAFDATPARWRGDAGSSCTRRLVDFHAGGALLRAVKASRASAARRRPGPRSRARPRAPRREGWRPTPQRPTASRAVSVFGPRAPSAGDRARARRPQVREFRVDGAALRAELAHGRGPSRPPSSAIFFRCPGARWRRRRRTPRPRPARRPSPGPRAAAALSLDAPRCAARPRP